MIGVKKVSKAWTLMPWLVPDFLARCVPLWAWENVERAVYDGYTRREWFAIQVAALQRINEEQGR